MLERPRGRLQVMVVIVFALAAVGFVTILALVWQPCPPGPAMLPQAGSGRPPASEPWLQWMAAAHAGMESLRSRAFSKIFAADAWNRGAEGDAQTRAGPGSTLKYTANVRSFLGDFIRTHNVTSVADLSCNEMFWQPFIPGFNDLELFAGYDIVPAAVAAARRRVEQVRGVPLEPNIVLDVRDMVRNPLDRAFDLVIVRDTLFHLPISDALVALSHINDSGSRYIATTTIAKDNIRNTFIAPGEWYPLNLAQPPFMFPEAEAWTLEGFEGTDLYGFKRLAIWKLPVHPQPVLLPAEAGATASALNPTMRDGEQGLRVARGGGAASAKEDSDVRRY